jgi:hypothetical protein
VTAAELAVANCILFIFVSVCFVTRTQGRIKITLSTVLNQAFYLLLKCVIERESTEERLLTSCFRINRTKKMAGGLLFDDESFEEK